MWSLDFSSQLEVAAEAAQAVEHLCGFDCDPAPWWERVLENAPVYLALGAFCLPVALMVVCLLHLTKTDRSIISNATIASVLALFVVVCADYFGLISLYLTVESLTRLPVPVDTFFFVPMLAIGFLGAAALSWCLKRRRNHKDIDFSIETFE